MSANYLDLKEDSKKFLPPKIDFAALLAEEMGIDVAAERLPRKPLLPQRLVFSSFDLEDTPPKVRSKIGKNLQPNVSSKFRVQPPRKSVLQKENLLRKSNTNQIKKTKSNVQEIKKDVTSKPKLTLQPRDKPLKAKTASNLKKPDIVIDKEELLSLSDNEFIKFENLLKNEGTPEKLSCNQKILQLIDEDRKAALKMQQTVSDFISLQEKRHCQITELLNSKKTSLGKTTPKHKALAKRLGSQSDGKILKKTVENVASDNGMNRALGLYNSMRSVSKSVLNTPKLTRNSLETPQSTRQRKSFSISKVIQKQCLMLHDTPSNH